MSIAKAEFPSSAAFDAINAALSDDKARQAAKKQGNAVFQFNIKNASGSEESWTLDLKESGKVTAGPAPKPTVTLSLSDDNFTKLASGKAKAQKLFMGGKLKIKGDVMKATKLEPIFAKIQTKAKL